MLVEKVIFLAFDNQLSVNRESNRRIEDVNFFALSQLKGKKEKKGEKKE